MPRRIDIELTSALADSSWTWRAAGARVPKGVLDGGLLPDGAKVGDVLKVEVEQELDGIEVTSVLKGREKPASDLLELLPVEENFQAVIETRAKRDRNDRGERDGRGGRDGKRGRRDDKGGRSRDGDSRGRGEGRGGDGQSERRGPRRPHFDPPPEVPQRPKPKRLRPGKARRNEVLAQIPEEQRPIAELAIQGMAAVRTRLSEDNKKLAADGKPTMPEDSVLKMAEGLIPKLRVADWLDRAEATQRQMENLDLRDLRSVVAASDDPIVARDESTRELATKLKADLVRKQDQELKLWLEDVDAALSVGRSIRALRLSSQPPKAGVMFPPELARKLGAAATAGLTVDDSSDRWAAVMEAAAFSPVRALVTPAAPPTTITDDLRKTALRLGPLLPQIAALLGVEVPAGAPRPKPLRPGPRNEKRKKPAARDGDSGGKRSDRGPKPAPAKAKPRTDETSSKAAPPKAESDAAPEQAAPAPEAPAQDVPTAANGAMDVPAPEAAVKPSATPEPATQPSDNQPAPERDAVAPESTEAAAPEAAPAKDPDGA
jgi:hypothetical protein